MARIFGVVLLLLGLLLAGLQVKSLIMCNYTYEKDYSNFWALADKSSTISAKQQYITQFVSALETGYAKGEFSDYNAVWLKTPNNSFRANLAALKTLAERLTEIQKMNPSSFEYNTAIQQITAQEQGEAAPLLHVIEGCYLKTSYPLVWEWLGALITMLEVTLIVVGVVLVIGDGFSDSF
jgi:hypothetical protein